MSSARIIQPNGPDPFGQKKINTSARKREKKGRYKSGEKMRINLDNYKKIDLNVRKLEAILINNQCKCNN